MSTSAPSPTPRATPGSRSSATPRRRNSSSIAASRKCSAKPISRTPCITRRSPPRRTSCFRRRRWASFSKYWRSGAQCSGLCSALRVAIARTRFELLFLVALALPAAADEIAAARKRWAESPHGPLLERILPPSFEEPQLPQPRSRGARLTVRYCVQCHNLPNPAMHQAQKWPGIVERMVLRMHGCGNLGTLMSEMMAGVQAPSEEETALLVAYLKRHAQKPLDPKRYPEVNLASGEAFRLACSQCHVLPDPRRHTAQEWRAVVARMQENMQWMNRVVASQPVPGEPQLRVEEISAFLEKYARRP